MNLEQQSPRCGQTILTYTTMLSILPLSQTTVPYLASLSSNFQRGPHTPSLSANGIEAIRRELPKPSHSISLPACSSAHAQYSLFPPITRDVYFLKAKSSTLCTRFYPLLPLKWRAPAILPASPTSLISHST